MGISWTLSEKMATWFATRFKAEGEPRIAEGQCEKSSILAYFDGRDEKEIVVNPLDINIVDNRSVPTPESSNNDEVLDTN